MNIAHIHPTDTFEGKITIPSSKSFTQRALALAFFAEGKTTLRNIGFSTDEKAVIEVLKALGAELNIQDSTVEIWGKSGIFEAKMVHTHESGLATRMLIPMLACSEYEIEIQGSGSILNRPMDFFTENLPQFGVEIKSNHGKLPISVKGPFQPKNCSVDGSMSSQFITGLMYAFICSPTLQEEWIEIQHISSIPYIHLSIEVAKLFGVEIKLLENKLHFQKYKALEGKEINIEGDWSSASFFAVAAALYGSIELKNLSLDSKQADKAILQAIELFGAKIEYQTDSIRIVKQHNKAFDFDATHCPDLFPPLVVLAAKSDKICAIQGVNRLIHKESNRAIALQQEFKKMGVRIELDFETDKMLVHPVQQVQGAKLEGHNDHRIVMAGAILALGADGETHITEAEAIDKSFPTFFELLNACIHEKITLKETK
jgi:3-phosphoshikimate 1-carboxyvinyltransferase